MKMMKNRFVSVWTTVLLMFVARGDSESEDMLDRALLIQCGESDFEGVKQQLEYGAKATAITAEGEGTVGWKSVLKFPYDLENFSYIWLAFVEMRKLSMYFFKQVSQLKYFWNVHVGLFHI